MYTLWDWMGDVGGLYGSLYIIGHLVVVLIQVITGQGIIQEIIESLYQLEAPRSQMNVHEIKTWLKRRQPLRFSSWSFLKCRRDERHARLNKKVEKELDIVRFLKKQMSSQIAFRLIFTSQ